MTTPLFSREQTQDHLRRGVLEVISLNLALIRTDGGTQPRAALDQNTVEEYADVMAEGVRLPPVTAVFDGKTYWLADGFHRFEAARRLHKDSIQAEVIQGTRRDAVLYSAGANTEHGLRRTSADKRRAAETLLRDEEWGKWSDREIARITRVSNSFVSGLRAELGLSVRGEQIEDETRLVTRGGTTFEQRVSSEVRRSAARFAANLPAEPPTQTGEDAENLLRALTAGRLPSGEMQLKKLRDLSGLSADRFWRAFNLLEADGKIVRHAGKSMAIPTTVSLAPSPADEPAPGESAQGAPELEPVRTEAAPADAQEPEPNEHAAITEAVLEVFADAQRPRRTPQGSLAYGDVLRAVNELLGREVEITLFGEIITGLLGRNGPLRRDAALRLSHVSSAETPVPEPPAPDAPPEPAAGVDRAAVLQRDHAQAADAQAQNSAAWSAAQTRAALEKSACDVIDALTAASQVRGIRAWAETFDAGQMLATRNLIVTALATFDKARPHLQDLIQKLDVMIETGKPY